MSGFAAAFTAPMTITGGARIYSIYTSQAVFNGEVIDQDLDRRQVPDRRQAQLRRRQRVASAAVCTPTCRRSPPATSSVLFLADVPDQVRLLTIYGKLKMGFRNSSGQEVTFDVVDASGSGSQAPVGPDRNRRRSAPARGGTVDINVVNARTSQYVDVVYSAPNGANLDYRKILENASSKISLSGSGISSGATLSGVIPIATITTDSGVALATLAVESVTVDGQSVQAVVRTFADGTKETVLTAKDLGGTPTSEDLMVAALERTGSNRFRYTFNGTWQVGDVSVNFADGAVKNLDTKDTTGNTVTGASSTQFSVGFSIEGATAQLSEPGKGGSVDINVLNNRNWLDVDFVPGTDLLHRLRLDH